MFLGRWVCLGKWLGGLAKMEVGLAWWLRDVLALLCAAASGWIVLRIEAELEKFAKMDLKGYHNGRPNRKQNGEESFWQ